MSIKRVAVYPPFTREKRKISTLSAILQSQLVVQHVAVLTTHTRHRMAAKQGNMPSEIEMDAIADMFNKYVSLSDALLNIIFITISQPTRMLVATI